MDFSLKEFKMDIIRVLSVLMRVMWLLDNLINSSMFIVRE